MSEERRQEDKRIDEIHEDVKQIRNILQAENGVCVRLSVCERSIESTQKDLTEHKDNHKENTGNKFRRIDIYISAGMLILAVVVYFKK